MFVMLFAIAVIWVFFKLFVLGVKASWGVAKFLAPVILLPVIIVVLAFVGLFYIAIPLMIIAGVVALIRYVARA